MQNRFKHKKIVSFKRHYTSKKREHFALFCYHHSAHPSGVIPRQLECQRRSPVSVIRENLQPSLIQRRKCRFCRAEIGGHGNTDDHRQNTSHIIHTKLLDFLFIVISCKKQIQPACVSGQETLDPARAGGLDVLFRASKKHTELSSLNRTFQETNV